MAARSARPAKTLPCPGATVYNLAGPRRSLLLAFKGEHVGPYTLVRKIGPCPEGEDWKAHDQKGEAVAVRVYYEPYWIHAFREAGVPEKLPAHPGLDRLLQVGDDNRPWVSWTFAEGRPLREILERRKYIPLTYGLPIVLQVIRALAALHAEGLAHHDLRPEHVIIDEQGHVVLVRCQTAAYRALTLQKLRDKRAPMKEKLGKALKAYLPPEQARGEVANGATADMYALGRLIFETLCGELPHPLEMRHPSQRDPRIPKIFDKVVIDVLERRVRARTPDACGLEKVLLEGCQRAGFRFDFSAAPLDWVKDTPWKQERASKPSDLSEALADADPPEES